MILSRGSIATDDTCSTSCYHDRNKHCAAFTGAAAWYAVSVNVTVASPSDRPSVRLSVCLSRRSIVAATCCSPGASGRYRSISQSAAASWQRHVESRGTRLDTDLHNLRQLIQQGSHRPQTPPPVLPSVELLQAHVIFSSLYIQC